MTAIVSVETVLLVILVVLVAGLLRSHAEILRRLGPAVSPDSRGSAAAVSPDSPGSAAAVSPDSPGSAAGASGLDVSRAPERPAGAAAAPLTGSTPEADAVALDPAAPGDATLLAFLSSGCSTCAAFWAGMHAARLPAGVQPVVVTRGADRERPARLRELAPPGVLVVMSSQAWEDYAVPGSPYFVLVDGAIRGEGVATTWAALSSLVADAVAEARDAGSGSGSGSGSGATDRALDIERTLAAAGIGPDHPSLYPGGTPPA